jgi:dTDP-glucose pyrophosphorylase
MSHETRGTLRVVIPAAGEGSRFSKAGYQMPKPFIPLFGKPMIQHVIENVTPRGAQVHLLFRKDHIETNLSFVESLRIRGHTIHEVGRPTEGTACTLLLARDAFDDDRPLLVANSDQYVEFSIDDFVRDCFDRNLDGSILVFHDHAKDPKWSFARSDQAGLVREVAEKKPISNMATVGIYLFRRGSDFVRGAIDMIARNDRVNSEFYTCPVFNYLIARGLKIGTYTIASTAMHGLGTPEDLERFLIGRR